jgi:hypothetical protein
MAVFLGMLAIAVGAVSLFLLGLVGLFEAPWPVLLGILFAAFYGIQRIADGPGTSSVALDAPASPDGPPSASAPGTAPKPAPPDPAMTYRGVPYLPKTESIEPPDDVTKAATITLEGVYRGCHWQKSIPAGPAASPPEQTVIYRGQKVRSPHTENPPSSEAPPA